jgi:hypothetical protein
LHRAFCEPGIVVHDEHQNTGVRLAADNPADGLEPTDSGHGHIQYHYVGLVLDEQCVSAVASVRLGHDLNARLLFQQAAVAGAHHCMVIDQHDSDHCGHRSGQTSVIKIDGPHVAGPPSR